jgi:hypothetical protein
MGETSSKRFLILILIDDKQADRLDQEFVIGHGTLVSFVKLTLLVGG